MKHLFKFLILILMGSQLQAQQITGIEYAFDTDPGIGLATYIDLPDQLVFDSLLHFNTTGLSAGQHQLIFRLQDTSGMWSVTQYESFYLATGNSNFSLGYINAIEYRIDSLTATPNYIMMPAQSEEIDTMIHFDLSGLTLGYHQLYIRTDGINSAPSHYTLKPIVVMDGSGSDSIVAAEAYFDTDPGFGNGINISFDPSPSIDTTVAFTVPSNLSNTDHVMYIRTRDNAGTWSHYVADTVRICTVLPVVAGFDISRFGDFIYAIDSSEHASNYLWKWGDGSTSQFQNPDHAYMNPGNYTIEQHVTNSCNVDSASKSITVIGLTDFSPHISGLGNVTVDFLGGGMNMNNFSAKLSNGANVYNYQLDTILPDGLRATGFFDLHNAVPGVYDLEVNIGSYQFLYADTFTILDSASTSRKIDLTMQGPGTIRTGIPATYHFILNNEGNVDQGVCAINILVPLDAEVTALDSVIYQDLVDSTLYKTDSIGYLLIDTVNGMPIMAKEYIFSFPHLPVGDQIDFPLKIKFGSNGSRNIYYNYQGPYSGSDWFSFWDDCFSAKMNLAWTVLESALNLTPGLDCAVGISKLALTTVVGGTGVLNDLIFGSFGANDATSIAKDVGSTLTRTAAAAANNCAGEVAAAVTFGTSMAVELAVDVGLALWNIKDANDNYHEKCFDQPEPKEKEVRSRNSFDPNEKIGNLGSKDVNFIQKERMIYSTFFENADSATLPAQIVTIVDTLSENLDLSTLEILGVGLGEEYTNFMRGQQSLSLNLKYNGVNVKFASLIDTNTRELKFIFNTLDSNFFFTSDPLAGFLPPNDSMHSGEGYVSYTIMPKTQAGHLDTMESSAKIVFDSNTPIVTNNWRNVIDTKAPVSQLVDAIPINDSIALLVINASDDHAGVERLWLYSSKNGQDFKRMRIMARDSLLLFLAKDTVYDFYVEAIDSAGNTEQKSPQSEVSVILSTDDILVTKNPIEVYPTMLDKGSLHLKMPNGYRGEYNIEIVNLLGQKVYEHRLSHGGNTTVYTFDHHLESGMYIFNVLSGNESVYSQKIIKQ